MHNRSRSRLSAQISTLADTFLRLGETGSSEEEVNRIRAVRLATVWNSTPWMMAANFGNAVLTIIVFANHPSALLVNIVCGLLIVIAFHTSLGWWRGHGKPIRRHASIRGTRNAVIYGALLSFLWATIDIIGFADATGSQKQVLIALTVGMTAGAGFALATVPAAAIAFCGIMGMGVAISLLLTSDVIGLYLFALFLIYVAIIVRASLALCKSITERVQAKLAALEQRDVINLLLNDFEENDTFILDKPIIDALPFARIGSKPIDGTETREDFHRRMCQKQSFRDADICVEQAGELAIWSLTAKAIIDASGTFTGYRGVGRDVTASREARLRIEHMARHDPLTDVGNRTLLNEDLTRAIARHERFADPFSVLLLDLDRFKPINDTLGHAQGDRVLVDVAARLKSCMREVDTVARPGADEFVLLAQGNDAAGAEAFDARVRRELALPEPETIGARYPHQVSGGQLQRLMAAMALITDPEVVILDEPTKGIDVGAKQAVYQLIAEMVAQGLAVILVSSELPEVMHLAHRTLVMRRGRLVAEFARQSVPEAERAALRQRHRSCPRRHLAGQRATQCLGQGSLRLRHCRLRTAAPRHAP